MAAVLISSDPVASTSYAGSIQGPGGFTKANVLSGATVRTLTLTGSNTGSNTWRMGIANAVAEYCARAPV